MLEFLNSVGRIMRILITNDDGINSLGLRALIKGLKGLGEIVVVAPDREQSGVGASFTLHQPLRVKKLRSSAIEKYSVSGTPGDSVIVALNLIAKDNPIDLVVSGINQGTNLGMDVFLSGTVGAAIHGHLKGIPSIAVSMPFRKRLHYSTAAAITRKVITELTPSPEKDKGLFLNITVPNLPLKKIKGVHISKLRQRSSNFEVTPGNDGRSDYYWISVKMPKKWSVLEEDEIGTDVWAMREKFVSITPLTTDVTAIEYIEKLDHLKEATESFLSY